MESTAMTRRFDEDLFEHETESLAELRGHRRIYCRTCGYRGWSEDTGMCPRCPLEQPKEEPGHDEI